MNNQEWQPIETAPTDGTPILVYAQDTTVACDDPLTPFITVCAYHENGGFCVCEIREATHWMHLPEPPQKNS